MTNAKLDHTALETLQRCEQEYVYRHVRNLTGVTESMGAFFGRIVHEGIRVWHETADADAAAMACLVAWEREAASVRLPEPMKPDFRTPGLAAAITRLYATNWPVTRRGYDVVLNECYLEHGADHGIVDRVVRRHVDGLLYVLDLKTSSWGANAAYWQQWHNSQQAAIYLDLVEAKLGEAPAGFWCDHVFVSGRKDGPKPDDFVQYGPVAYSGAKREELRKQREDWQVYAEQLDQPGLPPLQSTRSCFRFQAACPFLDYCAADPADRGDMIARDLAIGSLVERAWDPARRDEA